ncbi:MAG: NADH-quinone oxidoreductase subunit D [Candidatus Methanomethylicota archaeon]|uniref:NADH-quinone oxidoreductase subunit D n=1 Tax=Thermoproteota archaeon TaxID=2056631 RepID=A0A497ELW6_9CREN|nr:MAG: NADH-quinone oxidoreductase subunit D [Candidatus Verstraetearchaeota archaeon]
MSGEDRYIELLWGPQHPSSGHMRFIVKMDGDVVSEFYPDPGYRHVGIEKIAETKTYIQIIPLIERPAILDAANLNFVYVLALEKLLDIEAPPRAQYLRTMMAEFNRIASHLYGIGIFGIMIGSSTEFMWAFGDREIIIELMQMVGGARLTYSYMVPGGVRNDLPDGFKEKALKGLKYIERRLEDHKRIFLENAVTLSRLVGVGVIKKEEAIKLGIVGPNLRASGVRYDVRKAEPYGAYPELDFEMAVREEGDCYARLMVRIDEIKTSIYLIRQILDKMPSGPILHERFMRYLAKWKAYMERMKKIKFPPIFVSLRPPKGDSFARVECGRGEATCYIVSDGSTNPYRVRLVTPSFRNIIAFKYSMPGHRLADIPSIYGSLDYFPPGADR